LVQTEFGVQNIQQKNVKMLPLYQIGYDIRAQKREWDLAVNSRQEPNHDIIYEGNKEAHLV
jgi:hypothetical protein